jgi:tRNA1(Val) A37 N6-methylase TrmN6
MTASQAKLLGQYFTPEAVASSLVGSVVRSADDRVLDPACGDGQFLRLHPSSVGVELSDEACTVARMTAPRAQVHHRDFFAWAEETEERFDCIVGNPPFIRYQHFAGPARARALRLAHRAGAKLTGLTSSWAPFVAVASTLLKPGGRMGLVVPAEIGHAPYAVPLLDALCSSFESVRIIAVREKIFPELSEDAWLLLALGRGGRTDRIQLSLWEAFEPFSEPPAPTKEVTLHAWRAHGSRLRKFLLPDAVLEYYHELSTTEGCCRLGDVARVGIGYVTGANDFFHLRPSEAAFHGIPRDCLAPSIRKGEQLPNGAVKLTHVAAWLAQDMPILLLHLAGKSGLPPAVRAYLDTPGGRLARRTYKCRNRRPWYAVPDVVVPDAFISYMSGARPALARNLAGCVCTNSIHAVRFHAGAPTRSVYAAWEHPISDLSKELEGHPLGGGLLKLEPGEARQILLPLAPSVRNGADLELIQQGIQAAREWRHCGYRFPCSRPELPSPNRVELSLR